MLMCMVGPRYTGLQNGSVDCVKYCVEMDANVNTRNHEGYTALHYATSWGHVNAVLVLLDADAIVETTSKYGFTPLYRALCNKHVDVTQLLVDWGAKVSNVNLGKYLQAIPDWVNRDPIVVVFPLPSLGCTNAIVPLYLATTTSMCCD
jgi:ankyrin repeat protein